MAATAVATALAGVALPAAAAIPQTYGADVLRASCHCRVSQKAMPVAMTTSTKMAPIIETGLRLRVEVCV